MGTKPDWSHHEQQTLPDGTTISSTAYDDAEKGIFDSTPTLPVIATPPPVALLDEKKVIETVSSADGTVTPPAAGTVTDIVKKKPTAAKPKPKPSKWILFQLWFNTYRKFFTFVTVLNLVGIILAAVGKFEYAENHLGALVLGNLLMAVLMRNELFLRALYLVSIYGLRSVCGSLSFLSPLDHANIPLVGTGLRQGGRDFDSAACGWYSLWLCPFWCWVRGIPKTNIGTSLIELGGWCTRSSTSSGIARSNTAP